MKIPRIFRSLEESLEPGKVLLLYGPRQVGKTTLLNDTLKNTSLRYHLDTGDNMKVQNLFESQDLKTILSYAEGYDLIALDEAQRIPSIGIGLKMLVDHLPKLRIIATGSSSFELAGQVGEPLTGRKKTLTLFPVSQLELKSLHNDYELEQGLEEFLIFGSYPEIITTTTREQKIQRLEELTFSYLLKDILELERVKSSKILLDLLRLIAFQIGQEVSHSELGTQLGLDSKTLARYLDLFEKSFILYNVRGYSRNLRSEITKKSKYYFYDNGIRNALISNYNPLAIRNDIGQLWENFVFMERLKKRTYQHIPANVYFWRTYEKQEIDIVEEREGKLFGYECKWQDKKVKPPPLWLATYPEASFEVIHRVNYLQYVS